MNTSRDVLVVGAGLAGLAAARELTNAGQRVLILEKSRGVGGRAANKRLELSHLEEGKTHLDQVVRADHGAQFFTARHKRLNAMLPRLIEQGLVCEWSDGFDRIGPQGHTLHAAGHSRYACPNGMTALGKALAAGLEPNETPLQIETNALVSAIWPSSHGWSAVLENGTTHHASSLIVSTPAPQALTLSQSCIMPATRAQLARIQYEPCWALIAALTDWPDDDRKALCVDHPMLAWVSFDHSKQANPTVPVLFLHANADWSRQHLEARPEWVAHAMLEAALPLLGQQMKPQRVLAHRWRYAKPTVLHTQPCLTQGGLVFCGDWCVAPSIEGALESGWAAAQHLRKLLPSPLAQA